MRSQSDHPRSASDRNDSYELCKKAKCYALRSSGTWTPIVNIIAVIPAGSGTASFSVVAHILLWFNTSPPWLGVCREHQQEFKAILNDDKNHSNTANLASRMQTSNVCMQMDQNGRMLPRC